MPSKTILITGASSGIGAALARGHARAGVTLLLWGRDAGAAGRGGRQCRALGRGRRHPRSSICGDAPGLARRLAAADAATPIDLAIFNAGLGGSAPDDALGRSA